MLKRFTARWIESVQVATRTDFVDPDVPGLVLRVSPRGVKAWSLLYRRQGDQHRRRVSLGRFPTVQLADARAAARGHLAAIHAGDDPAGNVEELKLVETVDQMLDRFLKDYTTPGRRWKAAMTRIFAKEFRPAIGELKITEVKRTHILAICNAVRDRGGKGVSANYALAAIRKAFNWAVSEGYLEVSPATNIPQRVKEVPRERALSESEIRTFWTGMDNAAMTPRMKIALRLALVTGQRIGEVVGATWAEVDIVKAEWLIPAGRSKNKREHMVPLSPLAVELFREAMAVANATTSTNVEPIFPVRPKSKPIPHRPRHLNPPSVAHAMRQALPQLGLAANPATPHDLRRTVASQMAAMGIAENIVARVLNHSSEIGKTITGRVYIRHSFAAEKRHALEAWAQRLQEIIEGRTAAGNVVKLQR